MDKEVVVKSKTHSHWTLQIFPHWQHLFHSVEHVLEILSTPDEILQEHSRSVVCLIRCEGQAFIAKRSKRQERWRWLQFTSLYRQGEETRTLRNMARLYALGLPVPEPVLFLEKRRYGFVVASWSMYRYVEGRACTCSDAPHIAKTLKQIHQKRWVHRDPHVENFLMHDGQVSIIDCARARPWRSRYAQIYDVVLLNNCCPGSMSYYGISESDWLYRLAKTRNHLLQFWRWVKRIVSPWRYRNRETTPPHDESCS